MILRPCTGKFYFIEKSPESGARNMSKTCYFCSTNNFFRLFQFSSKVMIRNKTITFRLFKKAYCPTAPAACRAHTTRTGKSTISNLALIIDCQ